MGHIQTKKYEEKNTTKSKTESQMRTRATRNKKNIMIFGKNTATLIFSIPCIYHFYQIPVMNVESRKEPKKYEYCNHSDILACYSGY